MRSWGWKNLFLFSFSISNLDIFTFSDLTLLFWCSLNHPIIVLITPPRNRGGVIFSLQFVCVSDSACEQNSSRMACWLINYCFVATKTMNISTFGRVNKLIWLLNSQFKNQSEMKFTLPNSTHLLTQKLVRVISNFIPQLMTSGSCKIKRWPENNFPRCRRFKALRKHQMTQHISKGRITYFLIESFWSIDNFFLLTLIGNLLNWMVSAGLLIANILLKKVWYVR